MTAPEQDPRDLLRRWQQMYNAMDSKHEDRHPSADDFRKLRQDTHALLAAPAPAHTEPGVPTAEELSALLPGAYYMDLPDGGSPTLLEQLTRQAADARKWVEHIATTGGVDARERPPRERAKTYHLKMAYRGDARAVLAELVRSIGALQEDGDDAGPLAHEIFDKAMEAARAVLSGSPAPTEPSDAHRALRALIAHWHEFGPEHGFDEMIDAAIRATTRDAAEQSKGSK